MYPAPRSLPLILGVLALKEISGNPDPSRVYLELLSRHMDGGFFEMTHEEIVPSSCGWNDFRRKVLVSRRPRCR